MQSAKEQQLHFRSCTTCNRVVHIILFCDLGILELFDLIKLRIYVIMFKVNNELLPDNLKHFFNVKYTMLHVTRQSNKLKHVYARKTLKAQCTCVYGVKVWNSLDESIGSSVTIQNLIKTI